ncbi:MAG: C25 family cysteine peptidase, partial [Anaerolineae bacterium]
YSLSTFQIYEDFNLSAAREVALEIVDQNGNDRLDPGDAIRFYGQEPAEEDKRYTGARVYWLVAGPGRGPGKRMATRPAPPGSGTVAPDFPATVHVEDNQRYWSNIPEGVSSTWYWELLNQTNPGVPLTRDYSVSTPGVSSGSHQVTVRAKLVGASSLTTATPDHSTELSLNSNLIASATWDGHEGFFLQGDAASSILSASANTVQVRIDLLPNVAADVQLVDWLEVDYRRTFQAQNDRLTFTRPAGFSEYRITGFSGSNIGAYDVTDPRSPVRLTDTQTPSFGTLRFQDATPAAQKYISVRLQSPALLKPDSIARVDAGVDLRAATNGATYIIITHADFTAAANRLAGYRAAEFNVQVVQVQDIYNQFGNAVLDAEAIHDFLAYAVANWSPSPQYVVLIGDGTYDYRDYLGEPRKIFIPPYQAVVDPWLGETADENHYAAVVGADSVPDLYIGRLPANSPAEADAMVDKILSYESGTAPSTPESVLLVADDYEPWVTLTNFPALSDALARDSLPNSYAVKKVYYRVTHGTVSAARSAITGNINLGQRFVNYIGHAGVERWADEGLWTSSDADLLANAGTYPVVLGMTCLEGAFQDVLRDAVAEAMLRAVKKGAVASWSATGLGVGTGHRYLNHGFYDALFRDGVRRLGPAAVAGKVRLYNTGTNLDLVHTFALLGDPATDTRILVPCVADITGDGTVDANDLAALTPHWHTFIGAPFDQDGNGYINIIDFILVATGWNSPCGG